MIEVCKMFPYRDYLDVTTLLTLEKENRIRSHDKKIRKQRKYI